MAYNNYNNNQKEPASMVYSPISFSNPDFMDGSRLGISYFNKLLMISIAKRSNNGTNDQYATYDMKNQLSIYLSYSKAKILYDSIQQMKNNDSIHNVAIETNKGLLIYSDGSDYNSELPCISINVGSENGSIITSVYQFRNVYYSAANYNMNSREYEKIQFPNLELDTFENVLLQYFINSSYSIAASVMESNKYKRQGMSDRINAIAEKVGVQQRNNGGYSNHTTFIGNDSQNNSQSSGNNISLNNGTPKEYETTTYDDIVNGMMG